MTSEKHYCDAVELEVRLDGVPTNRGIIKSCAAYNISRDESKPIPNRECEFCEFNENFQLKQLQRFYLHKRKDKLFGRFAMPARILG